MQRQIRKLMKGYRLGFWSEAIGRRCEKSEERCYVWIGNQSFTTGNFIQVVIYFYLVTSSRYIRLLYFFWPSSDPGLCTSIEERFLKFYWRNILDNSKNSLFLFHIFGVRRPLKALDPWIWIRFEFYRIRFRASFLDLGHQWNVCHQKYENKKEDL